MTDLYEGICRGGPLDGQPGLSRNPKGFLLVDRQTGKAWLYTRTDTSGFHICPDPSGDETRKLDMDRAVDAAVEPDYDVRSVARPGRA